MTDIVELKDLKGRYPIDKNTKLDFPLFGVEDGNLPCGDWSSIYASPTFIQIWAKVQHKTKLIKKGNWHKTFTEKLCWQREGIFSRKSIEYDQRTKQYLLTNSQSILMLLTWCNGEELSHSKGRNNKEGEASKLADGTDFPFPSSSKGIRSNKRGLVLSVMMDGGLSLTCWYRIQKCSERKSRRIKPIAKESAGLKKSETAEREFILIQMTRRSRD